MQVNRVQNTDAATFGMALKINRNAEKFLRKQTPETLNKLEKLGEEFKNNMYWHLVVTDKGFGMQSKSAPFLRDITFRKTPSSKLAMDTYYWHPQYSWTIRPSYIDKMTAAGIVEKTNKLPADAVLDRFATAVRVLEKNSASAKAAAAVKNPASAKAVTVAPEKEIKPNSAEHNQADEKAKSALWKAYDMVSYLMYKFPSR